MSPFSICPSKPKEPAEMRRARATRHVVPGLGPGLRLLSVHSAPRAESERERLQTSKAIRHCGGVQGRDFVFYRGTGL